MNWRPKYNNQEELAKCFEPVARTGGTLRPPAFFDHPLLKKRPDNITEALADRCVDVHVGKACSGLNRKHRANGAEVRRAFKACHFEGRVLSAVEWAVAGMREDQMERFLATCGLTVKEIAEGFRALFGGSAFDYANYVNHLADERLRAETPQTQEPWLLRGHVSMLLTLDDLLGGMAPPSLFVVNEGCPNWCAKPTMRQVIITMGHLHYFLDADELQIARQSRSTSELQAAMPMA